MFDPGLCGGGLSRISTGRGGGGGDNARKLPIRQFRAAVGSWLAHANPNDDGNADPANDPDTSELHVSETIDGIWMLTGSSEPSDASVPDRYRVGITINAEDLARFANHPASCDSPLYRAVINSKGEIVDIGRTAKEWSTGIRRAITLRGRGCRFPGCDRPPSRTDIHHCHEWDKGGPTCMNNGVLLCRAHHTFVHTNTWTIAINNSQPIFRKPDGTIHQPRRHQLTL